MPSGIYIRNIYEKQCIVCKDKFLGKPTSKYCKNCYPTYCIICGKKIKRKNTSKKCIDCFYKTKITTVDVRQKISKKLKNRIFSDKHKENISFSKLGKKNASYIDGRSYEPYSNQFTKKLKLEIRKRDDFTCQKCYIREYEHFKKYRKVLTIHHIDYNKKNNTKENLISLCLSCNTKVNFNRSFFSKYFQTHQVSRKYKKQIR